MNDDALFGMANLPPEHTGLPFVVWISPGWGAQDDVHVYVSERLTAKRSEMISIAICPQVRVVQGKMSVTDLRVLSNWVEINRDTLTAYWNRDIEYTIDAINALRPILSA
jgi:hypothetical protein